MDTVLLTVVLGLVGWLSLKEKKVTLLTYVVIGFVPVFLIHRWVRLFFPLEAVNWQNAKTESFLLILCFLLITASYRLACRYLPSPQEKKNDFKLLKLSPVIKSVILCFFVLLCVLPGSEFWAPWRLRLEALLLFTLLFAEMPKETRWLDSTILLIILASVSAASVRSATLGLAHALCIFTVFRLMLKFSRRHLLLFCLLFSVMCFQHVVKAEYRSYLQHHQVDGLQNHVKILAMLFVQKMALDQKAESSGYHPLVHAMLLTIQRPANDSLEKTVGRIPGKAPYQGLTVYSGMGKRLVPRFLSPEKASSRLWNHFGKEFGYLEGTDNSTSIGVHFLAESYIGFGIAGIATAAIVFGVVIAIAGWIGVWYETMVAFPFLAFFATQIVIPVDTVSMMVYVIYALATGTAIVMAALAYESCRPWLEVNRGRFFSKGSPGLSQSTDTAL